MGDYFKIMKINNIEIEDGPFPEGYLDECIEKIDVMIDTHYNGHVDFFDMIKGHFEAIDDEGVGKIIYIHHYPKELVLIFGVKIIGDIP